jgi:hypothetical protein
MYTDLITAVDFAAAQAGFLEVFGVVAGVLIAWKGGKYILRAIRGA